jgi:hypothetical protein
VAQDTRSPCSVAFGVMQHGNDLVRSQTPNPCINAAARVGLALSCRPLRKRRWKRMQVISFCDRSVGTGSGFKLINHTATSVRACRQPQPPGYHTMPRLFLCWSLPFFSPLCLVWDWSRSGQDEWCVVVYGCRPVDRSPLWSLQLHSASAWGGDDNLYSILVELNHA